MNIVQELEAEVVRLESLVNKREEDEATLVSIKRALKANGGRKVEGRSVVGRGLTRMTIGAAFGNGVDNLINVAGAGAIGGIVGGPVMGAAAALFVNKR